MKDTLAELEYYLSIGDTHFLEIQLNKVLSNESKMKCLMSGIKGLDNPSSSSSRGSIQRQNKESRPSNASPQSDMGSARSTRKRSTIGKTPEEKEVEENGDEAIYLTYKLCCKEHELFKGRVSEVEARLAADRERREEAERLAAKAQKEKEEARLAEARAEAAEAQRLKAEADRECKEEVEIQAAKAQKEKEEKEEARLAVARAEAAEAQRLKAEADRE
jgi:membrane protein involved in colicin uptake